MQLHDAQATTRRLPLDRPAAALRAQLVSSAEVPSRHVHELAGPDGSWLTSLPRAAYRCARTRA